MCNTQSGGFACFNSKLFAHPPLRSCKQPPRCHGSWHWLGTPSCQKYTHIEGGISALSKACHVQHVMYVQPKQNRIKCVNTRSPALQQCRRGTAMEPEMLGCPKPPITGFPPAVSHITLPTTTGNAPLLNAAQLTSDAMDGWQPAQHGA